MEEASVRFPVRSSRRGCRVGMQEAMTTTSASILLMVNLGSSIERRRKTYLVQITSGTVPSKDLSVVSLHGYIMDVMGKYKLNRTGFAGP